LLAKPRKTPPREIKITGEVEAHITQLACSEAPEGQARWTLTLLAERLVEIEVFDTELWTEEALVKSAARYGMTVQEYKTKNLLHTEIKSTDVARLVSTVAGPAFKATTGAQIPIDGGNDRVI